MTVKAKTTLLTSFWSKRSYQVPSFSRKKLHPSKAEKKDANRYVINEFIICENKELTLVKRKGGIGQILGKPSKTSQLKQLSQLTSSDGQSWYTQLDSSIIKSQDWEKNKTSIAVSRVCDIQETTVQTPKWPLEYIHVCQLKWRSHSSWQQRKLTNILNRGPLCFCNAPCVYVRVRVCTGSYIFMNKALLLCKFQPLHFDYFLLYLYSTQAQHRGHFKPPPQSMILQW